MARLADLGIPRVPVISLLEIIAVGVIADACRFENRRQVGVQWVLTIGMLIFDLCCRVRDAHPPEGARQLFVFVRIGSERGVAKILEHVESAKLFFFCPALELVVFERIFSAAGLVFKVAAGCAESLFACFDDRAEIFLSAEADFFHPSGRFLGELGFDFLVLFVDISCLEI